MREKFKNFADSISSGADLLPILQELIPIFGDSGMHHEEGACFEKMFNITKNPELYEKIGDVFLYKLRNRNVAKNAYDKFLCYSNPEFYKKYANNLKQLGYNSINTEHLEIVPQTPIEKLCDMYNVIAYMILYLHKDKEYDAVLSIAQNLFNIKKQIDSEKKNCFKTALSCLNDIKDTDIHLSEVLATTLFNIEINRFAIKLNSLNKNAYFNIVGGYIAKKDYKEAVKYYNTAFAKTLNEPTKNSVPDICWTISDYFRDRFDFYMAVYFQKLALEYELEKR